MTFGTCYFVSKIKAVAYYKEQMPGDTLSEVIELVNLKIEEENIFIGKPELKEGETLTIIDDGRYAIQTHN